MNPNIQVKVGAASQSTFAVPASFPTTGLGIKVRVNGVEAAFTRTSATAIALRTAARAGSLVDFYEVSTPTAAGLAWTGTLDFPSIAATATASLTCAVQGAEVGDIVSIGRPASPAVGVIFEAYVSALNVVTVRATNVTAAAVDPASATYRIRVAKA